MFFAEFFKVEAREGDDAAMLADELATDLDGAGPLGPGAEEDREELFVRERAGAQGGHLLPWFLIGREVVDALVVGHRN